MTKRKTNPKKGGTVGAFKAKPTIANRRDSMKYRISTTSTTASGVIAIKGATKYPDEPSIYFTREAWVKQCHLVRKCDKEVGWFALVDYDEEHNSFTITELVIPCQEVTAAETDIDKEDLADAAMELIEAGKDTSKMFAWFHSHVNMGVSPSAQDEYQVEDFLEDLADQPEVPAFIRGIQNKAGDLKLDVYYIQHGIAYQNVDFNVIHDDDPAWCTDIETEIKTKVTERTAYQYSGYGGSRQTAGKQQGTPNRTQSPGGNLYDSGFHGYYDDWDDWEYNNDGNEALNTGNISELPVAIPVAYDEQLEMEGVYQVMGDNLEVLLDKEGKLWVCDALGDMYDYNAYIEVFGEIDASPTAATRNSAPALII